MCVKIHDASCSFFETCFRWQEAIETGVSKALTCCGHDSEAVTTVDLGDPLTRERAHHHVDAAAGPEVAHAQLTVLVRTKRYQVAERCSKQQQQTDR